MKKETKFTRRKFKCPFPCGFEFEENVFYDEDKKISSQVKCPKCMNLIPTWKIELIGNLVGRKHIHIRR